MQLPNPKELKALLKVCRDFGVSDVSFGELTVKFGDMPSKQSSEDAEGAQPSAEELAYWSSQPDPLAQVS